MMLPKNIDFYYYSGTGNTLLVLNKMVEIFKSNEMKVEVHPIEHTDPQKVVGEVVGLAFPVAYQSAFPFLWKFFKAMPRVSGTPIFMVDTLMAFSGAIVGPLKKVLTEKGYNCIGAKEIIMPSNWFPKKNCGEKNKVIIETGLVKAAEYATDLLNGKTSWGRIPYFSTGFYYLCCNDLLMNGTILKTGKKIRTDEEKCTKCGLCAKLCPCGNIVMGEYLRRGDACEVCMRCLCFCPTQAVNIPGKVFYKYKAVTARELQ